MKPKAGIKTNGKSASGCQEQLDAINGAHFVVEFDIDGTILAANENFLELMGFMPADVEGLHHSALLARIFKKRSEYQFYWERIVGGDCITDESERKKSDGETVWLQCLYSRILDEQGNPVRIVEISSDVTQGKVAELLEQGLHTVFRSAVEATSIIANADSKGKIIEVSEKFVDLSGYDRDEIIGQPLKFSYHPDMPKETVEEIWQTVNKGKIYHGILKNLSKTGETYYADTVIAPVPGKPASRRSL